MTLATSSNSQFEDKSAPFDIRVDIFSTLHLAVEIGKATGIKNAENTKTFPLATCPAQVSKTAISAI